MRALFVLLGFMAGKALAQEASPPVSAAPSRELNLQVGYAQGYDEAEDHAIGGPGIRLQWLERLGPYLALGAETAFYVHAGSHLNVIFDGAHHYSITYRPLFHLGGVGRAGVELGRVRPSLLVGLGWYKGVDNYLGYGVGAEVEVRPVDWLPLVLDARYHDYIHNFRNSDNPYKNYKTLGLGTRLVW